MKLPISVIILTYNEEKNIEACLQSVSNNFENIFIVDSFSTDKTLKIAKGYTEKIYEHQFENYGKQRNWALNNLSINTEWVLNLNADQRVTESLVHELETIFTSKENIDFDGFLIPRKTIFMDKWIKFGGHYPVYDAILFKAGSGICEESRYDQVFTIEGRLGILKSDVEDKVTDSLTNFILRHDRWSSLEAIDQILEEDHISTKKGVKQNLYGNPMEKRRYFKSLYMKLPLFVRPFLYFIYRYFFKLGILDGIQGLIFHFLQGFWFRFLVDAKIFEIKHRVSKTNKETKEVIEELYGTNF